MDSNCKALVLLGAENLENLNVNVRPLASTLQSSLGHKVWRLRCPPTPCHLQLDGNCHFVDQLVKMTSGALTWRGFCWLRSFHS